MQKFWSLIEKRRPAPYRKSRYLGRIDPTAGGLGQGYDTKYQNQPETALAKTNASIQMAVRAAMGDDAPPMQTQKFVPDSGLSDNGAAAHGHPGTSIRWPSSAWPFYYCSPVGVRHHLATLGGTDAGMRSSTPSMIAHALAHVRKSLTATVNCWRPTWM